MFLVEVDARCSWLLRAPRNRSPSQWPGMARSSTSAGRSRIEIAAASDCTRDAFAFSQREYPARPATCGRSDPTMTCQNEVDDYVVFTQGAANLIQ
jgi:hypothetical protein